MFPDDFYMTEDDSSDTLYEYINIPHSPRYGELHKIRHQRLLAISNTKKGDHGECDYIHAKGLSKSGTTYLTHLVEWIEKYLCHRTNYTLKSYHFKHNIYSICRDWTNGTANLIKHGFAYRRHEPQNISQVLISQEQEMMTGDPAYAKFFMGYGMHKLWKNNEFRWCIINAIRDPRNRAISRINTYYTKDIFKEKMDEFNDTIKTQYFLDDVYKYIKQTQDWYDLYIGLERDNPLAYYFYFYEDIRMHTFDILRNIIEFMGYYPHWINDELIYEIMSETSISKGKQKKNYFVNNGYLCSFEKESFLTDETRRNVNDYMRKTLSDELIEKFSRTCAID